MIGVLFVSGSSTPVQPSISLFGAVSLGVGAMIGAGIFALLGDAVALGGTAVWLAFILAGVVVTFSAYSYAKMGSRYPSAGGPVEFLIQGLGGGPLTGTINLVLWIANIAVLALVAEGLGGYVAALLGDPDSQELRQGVAVVSILVFTALNAFGAKAVARAELGIVVVKLTVLGVFCVGCLTQLDVHTVAPATWPEAGAIASCTGFVFVAYTGFGFITNAAEDMRDPAKTLPRALYLSVAIVVLVYTLVALSLVGTLELSEIAQAKEYALAIAAQPVFGQVGFTVIGLAAIISASSAINATLFGSANISYAIAKHGELPALFHRKIWRGTPEGLVITALLTILTVLALNLGAVASVASLAFLTTYASVHIAHLRVLSQTGANRVAVVLALLTSLAALVSLSMHLVTDEPLSLLVFVGACAGAFAFELSFRAARRAAPDLHEHLRPRSPREASR